MLFDVVEETLLTEDPEASVAVAVPVAEASEPVAPVPVAEALSESVLEALSEEAPSEEEPVAEAEAEPEPELVLPDETVYMSAAGCLHQDTVT